MSRPGRSARDDFFERFRAELARYADGVHELGAPAPAEELAGLPALLAAFLRSFNGAHLFIDALIIWPAARMRREEDLLLFGETSTGDQLALDLARDPSPVVRLEEDTGERLMEGTSFARWLLATVAAEGTLVDLEGDFLEGAFDEDGEIALEARIRRERKALRVDPEAPAPSWRLARALEEKGRTGEALRLLAEVTSAEPTFAWAHYDVGRLRRQRGDLEEAEAAFLAAADADPDSESSGFFAANAARIAVLRGDEGVRARIAARALELDPDVARAQKEAGKRLLADGADEEAREHLSLAVAVAPRDVELLLLLSRAPV